MTDREHVKQLLAEGSYTCVLQKEGKVYTSTLRGVKPLAAWLESGLDLTDACAADKVVGKATAFLYVLLGVRSVYARVISRSAREVLLGYGIETEADTLTEHIINRAGDGICPFEKAVLTIDQPNEAYAVIQKTMAELGITLK